MTDQLLPSDGQLLAEYVDSGGQRPFELLVRRHAALVLGVCRGVLREPHDAEDAAQAAFLTLARKAPSLRGQRTVAGWLHRVAWHVSMRAREARRLRRQRERDAAASLERTHESDDQATHDTAALVHEHLAALPEKYRVPLLLHHLEGWGEQEVARMLGCKLGTVSGRLSRARQMLKDRLETRGVRGAAFTSTVAGLALTPASEAQAAELARAVSSPGAHAEALALGASRMLEHARRRRVVITTTSIIAIAIIVSVAWFTFTSGKSSVPSAAPTHGSISGVVVGPSGRAVPNVAVRVWPDRTTAERGTPPTHRARTREDGSFLIPDVPAGPKQFILCFIQQPMMHARAELDVVAGQENSAGVLVLQPGRYD